jgi:hypothetical protein
MEKDICTLPKHFPSPFPPFPHPLSPVGERQMKTRIKERKGLLLSRL